MWHEIREKAKMELLHILFMAKINLIEENSAQSPHDMTPDTLFKEELPSKAVLRDWKFKIDMFTEHGLI